jgi:hypothetical protein
MRDKVRWGRVYGKIGKKLGIPILYSTLALRCYFRNFRIYIKLLDIDRSICYNTRMKNYADAYLLGFPYKLIASGWDSYVFIDGEDPEVVLKLYDSLTREQLIQYYNLHTLHAQNGVMTDGVVDMEVLDLGVQLDNNIIDNEDGVVVILPRINGINLTQYGTSEERREILERIQKIAQSHNLPITG